MDWLILIALIGVGVYDLYLELNQLPTLSKRYQRLFAPAVDLVIFGICMAVIVFPLHNLDPNIRLALGVIVTHLCWPSKETYRK